MSSKREGQGWVDKPFINGDSALTRTTDTMRRPFGPVADHLRQRAEWTAEFFMKAGQ